MTFEQLRIFLAVAERQHLTRAAEALHLTPSAVSSAIRILEDRYQVQLFDRVGRGIALSGAGRLFLGEAKAILERVAAAEAVLSDLGGLASGALLLGASQTMASYYLPRLLMRFHDAHPGIGIHLITGNTETIGHAVVEGRVELGFIEGAFASPLLLRRDLAEDELVAVVAPTHPWADGRRLGTHDIGKGRWVLREAGSGTRSSFEAFLRTEGIDPAGLEIALELPSNEAVLSAVEGGSSVAAVSIAAAASALAAGRVVRAKLTLTRRALSLIRHRERHATAAVQAFEALVLAEDAFAAISPPSPPQPRPQRETPAG
jgi:DNA-binding transcriptional LysR family regulator